MADAVDLGVDDVYVTLTELFGLKGQVHKDEFNIICPNPNHVDNDPSCDVNLVTGKWNCFSCEAFGDLVDLGSLVLGQRKGKVFKLLKPDNPDAIRAALQRRLRSARKAAETVKPPRQREALRLPPVGSYEGRPMLYLKRRGFELETLRRWGIRYAENVTLFREDGKPFEITHAVAIPILSETGKILAWCYRATEHSAHWFREVRYIYTPGVTETLNRNWFGMHLHRECEEITIVEGALDAIWCDQNGIPALAILGSQVKQMAKVRKLMDFRKVTILTDHDASGVSTAFHLGTALQERGVACSVSRYSSWMLNRKGEPAKDAQDLCGMDLELIHARAIPFALWKHRGRDRAA
jgi:DNA primase